MALLELAFFCCIFISSPRSGCRSVPRYSLLRRRILTRLAFASALLLSPCVGHAQDNYSQLVTLFEQWRAFRVPDIRKGAPDYTPKAIAARTTALNDWKKRLHSISTQGWPIDKQNDYRLVEAEMNGLDFELRVTKPWARDPAFYVSVWANRTDVPLREGPLAHPEITLYGYTYPLSPADQQDLVDQLKYVPALLDQAKNNLKDSNAHDLWVYGEQELRDQSRALRGLLAGNMRVHTLGRTQQASLTGASPELRRSVEDAAKATDDFIAWLEKLAPGKTGPSGVGKENYTWYQQNVHFLPFAWDEEVVLLRRELERAQASLRLEEHNNRNLPPLDPAADSASYDKLMQSHVDKFVSYLVDQQIIPDKPYLKEVIKADLLGHYAPEDKRVFFGRVIHREPMLLLSHDYHWIDLARMRDEPNPSPIRRIASTSNIFDTRAEGFATAFEEIMMHAGLYDDNPRAKELVWIMLANRAARGLASLYVQANQMNLKEAGDFHGKWTPRGWAVSGDQLTAFEQLLYLRQPGYGTSYITGKVLVDRLITEYGKMLDQQKKTFVLRDFMDRFNSEGIIPVPLMESELIPDAAKDHP